MRRALLALLIAACGGSVDSRLATPDQIGADCDRSCEYDAACLGADPDACAATCAAQLGTWVRADALETYATCRGALACEADETACLAAVKPLAIHRAYEATCREQLATCDVDLEATCAVEFHAQGDAGILRFAADEVMDALLACLDEAACAARLGCEQGVFAQYGISF